MERRHALFTILFLITGIFYYFLVPSFTESTVFVSRVIDGDTIEIEAGQKVRLIGINTPEEGVVGYGSAKDFLTGAVLEESVVLESSGVDRYGRVLGHVILDGENVNEKILREGLGLLYYYEKDLYYGGLKEAEEFARLNEKGVWKQSSRYGCVSLIDLQYEESGGRCIDDEVLILENACDEDIDVLIKDDATHMYRETLEAQSVFRKSFSCIFNDAGDSLYVWDEEGLLVFWRY
jgi:endonuclease YncB( thermonuclease family)